MTLKADDALNRLGFWQHAAAKPETLALVEADGNEISSGELLASANRLVNGFRSLGLEPGDCIAFVLPNGAPVLELFMAATQAGWFITPINNNLAAAEIAYILDDCQAKVLVASGRYSASISGALSLAKRSIEHHFTVDTGLEGFTCFEQFKALQKRDTPTQRRAGSAMTYTSGTTGRPKGVRRAVFECEPETVSSQQALFLSLFDMPPGSSHVHLTVAPLYHTAVLNFATNHLHLGHTVVLMDGWTPEGMLQRVQAYRVTTSHMVPTMFIRLLKMDQTERLQYDVSSLSHAVHGAAPCPLEIKHQMLDWWGESIFEYYAASEGGGTLVSAKQWRQKPGTVGPPWPISEIEIRDDDEELVPAGTIGTVWIAMGDYRFSYHGDDAKTRDAWRERFFTVGDAGYLDSEGWLFLSDRKSDMMISGGVNIYPAEIEAVLLQHPEVMDVAVFGIPDEDWGESVHARLQLRGAPDHFDEEIRGFCQDKLARFKQPKTYSYVQQLPRDPNGKLSKSKLRQSYLASLKLS